MRKSVSKIKASGVQLAATNAQFTPQTVVGDCDKKSKNSAAQDPIKLLLVDDDIVDRKAIIRLLYSRENQYDIDEACSYDQALELSAQKTYDCILLDFQLGGVDALELLPQLKSRSPDKRQAIVMITGTGNEYLAAQAFKAGIQDYIVKSNLQTSLLMEAIEHSIQSVYRERISEKQQAELDHYGLYDHLTGLPNRKLFSDRLRQALLKAKRQKMKFSLISIDLNRFNRINDTHGHEVGDAVICEVAQRLTETLRSTDTIARIGGDEFIAMLDVLEYTDILLITQKLTESMLQSIQVEDLQLDLGLSIGISHFPKDGSSERKLFKCAKKARLEAKGRGLDFVVYTSADEIGDDRSITIATDISTIVEDESLELEYQPKINLNTLEIIGAEALVRWRHPSLGLLPPVDFIPAVEKTHKIKPMTYQITEMAIKQCATWRSWGFDIPVAVNISAKVLNSPDMIEKVIGMLRKWHLPAHYLTLDVTETGVLDSQQLSRNILQELALYGVNISIDDFGSGYTSFRYLRDFTIHELKIDRIFIADLITGQRDESIVKSILELGRGFDVKVVAEGIENDDILLRLMGLGCEFGQGSVFSGALSPTKFVAWSSEWNSAPKHTTLSSSK